MRCQRETQLCLYCSLIQALDQFDSFGCANCEFLGLRENKPKIFDCTNSKFEGMISMVDPEHSWVSRWQRISGKKMRGGFMQWQSQEDFPLM